MAPYVIQYSINDGDVDEAAEKAGVSLYGDVRQRGVCIWKMHCGDVH